MTINERLRDELIAHRVNLTRYEAGVVSKLVATLSADDAELAARLLVALEDVPAGSISVKKLSRLLAPVREVNRKAVTRFFGELGQVLKEFTEYEAGFGFDLMKSLLPEVVSQRGLLKKIDAGQAYVRAVAEPFHGYTLKDWTDKLETDRFARIVNTIRTGQGNGDAPDQIVRSIRGTKARNWQDGALNKSRANASAIGYSALAHAAEVVREQTAPVNDHLIKAKQWLSTLDNKTSPPCRIRDALTYTLDNQPIKHGIPWGDGPGRLHFHCRSTYTLIFKSWQEMGLLTDDLTSAEKDALSGEVPEPITYPAWIARQRASRQDDILGPVRGKLLRSGGLNLTSFYTEDGRWLTLDELRQRDAAAFKRAGLD
ncbi:hypothetical protein EcCFBP13530_04590 [Enterobacter cancerogenus]|uniref:Phage Mu protein F like protein n=1 Tax=Enterobacter cancerogenus TaxID=69218 RepID=A0AB38P9E3_9ENTR|nr:hypothetical protein [Enterobacter cancerogenus]TKK23436.1 hypothetical protein EcCFBP13530_04590 [Enterobacter cancerogenus]